MRLTIACLLSAASLTAPAAVVYESNPPGQWFTYDAGLISGAYSIMSSGFTLNSSTTVSGAVIGVWNQSGDSLTSVDWRITTQSFGGTELASGTAAVANQLVANSDGNAYSRASFDLGDSLNLVAGTYWLELGNALTAQAGATYWDVILSASWNTMMKDPWSPPYLLTYQVGNEEVPASASFELVDSLSAVPEPSEWAAMSFGLLGIVWVVKRRFAPARS